MVNLLKRGKERAVDILQTRLIVPEIQLCTYESYINIILHLKLLGKEILINNEWRFLSKNIFVPS